MPGDRFTDLRRNFTWYKERLGAEWLVLRDRLRRKRCTGDCPVVVSLTTHGFRLDMVHMAIRSIVAGSVRPLRLILWLDAPGVPLPRELEELKRRGLEILYCDNFGPHTKYYPYVQRYVGDGLPLVTADDDVIYARDWLRTLWRAHVRQPQIIHCHLARRIALQEGALGPYLNWGYTRSPAASPLNFALGLAGVIYPPAFVQALHDAGEGFRACCPKADDVWLHHMALRHGYPVQQTCEQPEYPHPIPGSQVEALWMQNLHGGGNDQQIRATYEGDEVQALQAAGSG